MNRRWLMSEHTDDALDLAVLEKLRASGWKKHDATTPFKRRAAVMVGLGLPSNPRVPRCEQVEAFSTRGGIDIQPGSNWSAKVASTSLVRGAWEV